MTGAPLQMEFEMNAQNRVLHDYGNTDIMPINAARYCAAKSTRLASGLAPASPDNASHIKPGSRLATPDKGLAGIATPAQPECSYA